MTPQAFDPDRPFALLVTSADIADLQLYVGAPQAFINQGAAVPNAAIATLSATPVMLTAADWLAPADPGGLVYVYDEFIIPNTQYTVVATDNDRPLSDPSPTVTTWIFGDVDNSGVVNLNDTNLVVAAFQGNYSMVEQVQADLDPDGFASICLAPNQIVTLADAFVTVTAFQGGSYPCDPVGNPPTPVTLGEMPENPYLFTGRRLDVNIVDCTTHAHDLSLYHYRARAYDAKHGRFLQRDPAGYVDGMNLYEYVRSNPIRYRDPYGLDLTKTGPERYKGSGKGRPTSEGFARDCDCACIVELFDNAAFGNVFGFKHITIQVQDCNCDLYRIDGGAELNSVASHLTLRDGLGAGVILESNTTKRLETLSLSVRRGKAFSGFVKRLKKTNDCGRCNNLLNVSRSWNDKAHRYRAVLGPNSNSAAGVLLRATGFGTFRPPGALGWRDLFNLYGPLRIGTNQPDYVNEIDLTHPE